MLFLQLGQDAVELFILLLAHKLRQVFFSLQCLLELVLLSWRPSCFRRSCVVQVSLRGGATGQDMPGQFGAFDPRDIFVQFKGS